MRNISTKRAISPIIATLLLILIAIAAGVIVYAYVVGFIGNSTTNSGGTVNTINIDELVLSSKSTVVPATAYVRNQGPTTESFTSGFYIKGSSLNDQLVPAVIFSASGASSFTATSLSIAGTGSNSISLAITVSACTGTGSLTVTGFGATNAPPIVTCASGTLGTVTSPVTLTGLGFTTSLNLAGSSGISSQSNLGSTVTVVGFSITAGTMSVALNGVGDFTLSMPGAQTSSPLTSDSTYTVQVTGTDGASTNYPAKAF